MTLKKMTLAIVATMFSVIPMSTASATGMYNCTFNGGFHRCSGIAPGGGLYNSHGYRNRFGHQNTQRWNYQGRQLELRSNCFGLRCNHTLRY